MSRWAVPNYSKKKVNRAGELLASPAMDVDPFELYEALNVINN